MRSSYLSRCIAEQRQELEKLMMLTNEDNDSPLNSPPNRGGICDVSSQKSMQSSTTGSYVASSTALFDSMAHKHLEDEPSALPAPPQPYHAKHSKLPAFNGDRDNREDLSVDRSRGYPANSDGRLLSTAAQASKPYTAPQQQLQPSSPPPHRYTSAFSASLDVRPSTASSAAVSSADEAVGSAHLSALRQGAGGCTNNSSSSKCGSPKQALRSSNATSFAPASFSDTASSGSHKGPAWEPASLNNKQQQQQLHTSGDPRNGLNLYGGSSSSKDNFGLPGRYSSAGEAAVAAPAPHRQQQQQQYESYTDNDHDYQHELDGHDSVHFTSSPCNHQQQRTVGYMNDHTSSSKASDAEQEAHRNR
jgi:hypothetical protein